MTEVQEIGTEERKADVMMALPRRARMLGWMGYQGLRLLGASWHTTTHGLERLDEYLAGQRPVLLVFWHESYLPIFVFLRGRRACAFTSHSRRGDVIAAILQRGAITPVELPDHSGPTSYGLMRDAFRSHNAGAIAVDGPLGPYHHVKTGAIRLASDLGLMIVPAGTAARNKRIVSKRWDKLQIPRFRTRTTLIIGDPIHIPPEQSPAQLHEWAGTIKDVLEQLKAQAEKEVAEQ